MRKIILTIGVNVDDEFLRNEKVDHKYNIGSLLKNFPELQGKVKLNKHRVNRPDLISKFLELVNGDILIGFAVVDKEEYLDLRKNLKSLDIQISKVYIGLSDENLKKEYENFYNKHSRWLDYSPKDIRNMANEYDKEILEIANKMREDKIAVEVLSKPTA